jgi:hypothetical protein
MAVCHNAGMRMCSNDEMQTCCNTGCWHNEHNIWVDVTTGSPMTLAERTASAEWEAAQDAAAAIS